MAVEDTADLDSWMSREAPPGVDFEIAFTAFLATMVLTVRVGGILDSIGNFVALGLLFLTLIRKIAHKSPFSREKKIMNGSLIFIDIFSIFAVVYVFSSILRGINIPLMPEEVLLSVILLIFSLGVLFIHELVFRDLMPWLGVIFYKEYQEKDEEMSRAFLLDFSALCLSRINDNVGLPEELQETLDRSKEEGMTSLSLGKKILLAFVLIVVIGIYGAIGALAVWLVGGIGVGVTLYFAALFIPLPIEFWYSRYGYAEYSDFKDNLSRVLLSALTVVLIFIFL